MALNMNKLTEKAQEALVAAQGLAQERNHGTIEPGHLLAALLEQGDGVVPQIVSNGDRMADSAEQGWWDTDAAGA